MENVDMRTREILDAPDLQLRDVIITLEPRGKFSKLFMRWLKYKLRVVFADVPLVFYLNEETMQKEAERVMALLDYERESKANATNSRGEED